MVQGFEISREERSEGSAMSATSAPTSTGGGSSGRDAGVQTALLVDDRRIGQVIDGKYHVLRRLACGGMGSVYEARHTVVGRHVALKFLHEQYAQRSCMVQRFLREAQAAGSIASEHIIGVLDYGTVDGTPYLVMELVRGQDLREILAESPRLDAARAVRIVRDACRGLALAHERGLVHRDLKPANICVTRQSDGREVAKVIDFGVAKLRDGAELSEEGTLIGTLGYMAPEQLTDQKELDARADIYALGVILYQALAGRPPHICNRSELLYRIVSVDPKPLAELCPELPPGLCAVVHKALCRNKERRYSNVRELAAALEPFARDGQVAPDAALPAAFAGVDGVGIDAAARPEGPTRYTPTAPLLDLRDEPTALSRQPRETSQASAPRTHSEPGWTTFARDGQRRHVMASVHPASVPAAALPAAAVRSARGTPDAGSAAGLGTAETELGSSPTWAALAPAGGKGADRQCERVSAAESTRGALVEQYCRHPDGMPPPPLPPRLHHLSQRALLLSVGALALSVVAMTTMFIFVYSHGSGALEAAASASPRGSAAALAQRAAAARLVEGAAGSPVMAPPIASARTEHCDATGRPLHGAGLVDLGDEGTASNVSVQQHALRPSLGLGAYPGVRAIACE
jgi:serine/threonine protein kinase